MKFLLLASLFLLSLYGFNMNNEIPKNRNYVPDVMGNISIKNSDGNVSVVTAPASGIDSFPNFTGFPKSVTGNTYEGSIFCNMDSDSDLEIVINSYATPTPTPSLVHAINKDGSYVPGWPKSMPTNHILQGAPAFGDIDGDGQGEVVVGTSHLSSNGSILAFEKDGTPVTGFPVSAHGYTTRSMVLGDVDNNGSMEIITNKRAGASSQVFVYKGDGTVYPGWPKPITGFPASSSAVGDITGDGFAEIVAQSTTGLYAWDRDGNTITGFPFNLPSGWTNSYSSPVLADVDGGNREIIFGTHSSTTGEGAVYILKNDGTILPNWPKITSNWVYSPPAVGYIDGDTLLDIVVGDQVLSGVPANYIYGWNKNGTALSGFPIGPIDAVNSQVILANIDGDNFVELIFDDNTTDSLGRGKYHGYNHDGTPLAGWPIYTMQSTFFTTPSLTDIDRNGILDIIGTGTQINATTNIYLWNTGIPYIASNIKIPNWQYNERHDGVYNRPALVGVEGSGIPVVTDYKLSQNYPNPFNPVTSINYSLPKQENVVIKVYDMRGVEVAELVNSKLNAGSYTVDFNGNSFASGVYYYTIKAGSFKETKKMVLVK